MADRDQMFQSSFNTFQLLWNFYQFDSLLFLFSWWLLPVAGRVLSCRQLLCFMSQYCHVMSCHVMTVLSCHVMSWQYCCVKMLSLWVLAGGVAGRPAPHRHRRYSVIRPIDSATRKNGESLRPPYLVHCFSPLPASPSLPLPLLSTLPLSPYQPPGTHSSSQPPNISQPPPLLGNYQDSTRPGPQWRRPLRTDAMAGSSSIYCETTLVYYKYS